MPLEIPPLRQRLDDIPCLVQAFLEFFSKEHKITVPRLSADALANLKGRRWEGNVRELKNLIERIVVLNGDKGEIIAGDLPPDQDNNQPRQSAFRPTERLSTVDKLIEEYILFVLNEVGHHQAKASEILGMNRRTLYRKLKSYSKRSQNVLEYRSLAERLIH